MVVVAVWEEEDEDQEVTILLVLGSPIVRCILYTQHTPSTLDTG
jgi:hypothetical protein